PLGALHPVSQEHCWRLLWLTWLSLMGLARRRLRESDNCKKCKKTLLAMETRPAVCASDERVRALSGASSSLSSTARPWLPTRGPTAGGRDAVDGFLHTGSSARAPCHHRSSRPTS